MAHCECDDASIGLHDPSGCELARLAPYEVKAHKVIARYTREAWIANRCRPGYRVHAIAVALASALGIHDATDREHEIKRLFEVERLGAWTLI